MGKTNKVASSAESQLDILRLGKWIDIKIYENDEINAVLLAKKILKNGKYRELW